MLDNPEGHVLETTQLLIATMAADRVFVAYRNEPVRRVSVEAVRIWKVLDGSVRQRSPEAGLQSLVMPGILITPMQIVEHAPGTNCADDEDIRVAIQIVDGSPHHHENRQTYSVWMNMIRQKLLEVPNPFLAGTTPDVFDPYVVNIFRRVPADAQSLIRHEQQVQLMVFQVVCRHHR